MIITTIWGDQTIAGQLEKHVLKPRFAILTTYMDSGKDID